MPNFFSTENNNIALNIFVLKLLMFVKIYSKWAYGHDLRKSNKIWYALVVININCSIGIGWNIFRYAVSISKNALFHKIN